MIEFARVAKPLREIILQIFPDASPQEIDIDTVDRSFLNTNPEVRLQVARYLLWMLQEVETYNHEEYDKARSWVGWVQAHMEVMGLLTNRQSREIVRRSLRRR